MGQLLQSIPGGFKRSSAHFLLFVFKLFSGVFLGLTFALVGEEIMGYGGFSFWFVLITLTSVFLKASKNWKVGGVIIFDFTFILMILLFRIYVLIASGV